MRAAPFPGAIGSGCRTILTLSQRLHFEQWVPSRSRGCSTSSPIRRWEHRHEFVARVEGGRDGTVVRDVLEYQVGLAILGEVAEKLFVGRQMARTFAHRQRTLEALLASS